MGFTFALVRIALGDVLTEATAAAAAADGDEADFEDTAARISALYM